MSMNTLNMSFQLRVNLSRTVHTMKAFGIGKQGLPANCGEEFCLVLLYGYLDNR